MLDFLLEPNVAYLLLVAGFWMVMLAIMSPGSGFIELAALATLLLAGWGIINLPVNWWALGLLIAGGIVFILSILRPNRKFYLVLAILALVAGSSFLFRGEGFMPAVNPLLVLIVSAASAWYFWFASIRTLQARQAEPVHDLSRLIGQVGEVQAAIDPEGAVQMMGELWTARSQNRIPAGAKVRVVDRRGLVLYVEPLASPGSYPGEANPQAVNDAGLREENPTWSHNDR